MANIIRVIWRILITLLKLVLVLILVYGVAIILGALIPSRPELTSDTASQDYFIYLIDNGVHVEICLPSIQAPQQVTTLFDDTSEILLYCFGWGDRYFYPGTPNISDLELVPMIKALFFPSPGALGITWYGNHLIEDDHVRKIAVTSEQVAAIYEFITSYMADTPIENEDIASGYGSIKFFEAKGTYSLFYTCNNWTNEALKLVNIPTHVWTPTLWGVGYWTGR